MDCRQVMPILGAFIDGELAHDDHCMVETHLEGCLDCRRRCESLRSLVDALKPTTETEVAVPPGLWMAIEKRLEEGLPPTALLGERRAAGVTGSVPEERRAEGWAPVEQASQTRRLVIGSRRHWRPFAAAAAIVLAVAVGWGLLNLPGSTAAVAHTIDFTPLLDRVGGDLDEGLQALVEAYDGRPTTLEDAARTMQVRVHPPEGLLGEMGLKSTHTLNVGDETSLALHFAGSSGQLLIMQCAPGMRGEYGGRECLPCQVGSHPGQIVREGPWRLVHLEGDGACICVVSTLDENRDLPAVLEALRVDF